MNEKIDLAVAAQEIDRILAHGTKAAREEALGIVHLFSSGRGERDGEGKTLMHHAAVLCKPSAVNWLQDLAGLDHNSRDNEGLTALDHAAKAGRIETVEAMLKCEHTAGFERINYLNYDSLGVTTAQRARMAGHEAVAELIEQHERDEARQALEMVNVRHPTANLSDQRGWTGMHWTAHEANWARVQRMINAGADPHARDRNGETPLWLAVRKGDLDGFRILARTGLSSEVLWANREGKTVLFEAAQSDSEHAGEIVAQLLEAGADPFIPWQESTEILFPATCAMKYGTEEVACALFDAMREKDPEEFQLIMADHGQAGGWGGWLSNAVRWHRPEVVRKLMEIGWPKADPGKEGLEQQLVEATRHESRRAVEVARRSQRGEKALAAAEEVYRIFHDGEDPPEGLGRVRPAPEPEPSP